MSPDDLAQAYDRGLAEGRRLAALEASVALRQLGIDLLAQAHRGAVLLGNSSGPGAFPGTSQLAGSGGGSGELCRPAGKTPGIVDAGSSCCIPGPAGARG